MPLTELQADLGRLLAQNRTEDSYLAGGAAILASPSTRRYSQALDFFHDSSARVASAHEADRELLVDHGYRLEIEISQPGYIRAVVLRGDGATKVEWAHGSSWRFMPVIRSDDFGFQLHPIDLGTNKILTLAGRDEARDLLDALHMHEHLLALGPLAWAAVDKDPGFSPLSLVELLRRRGKVRPEDLSRLHLTGPVDLRQLKTDWLSALESAEAFVRSRPPDEAGCLYFSAEMKGFVDPNRDDVTDPVPHFGRPGGVLPRVVES